MTEERNLKQPYRQIGIPTLVPDATDLDFMAPGWFCLREGQPPTTLQTIVPGTWLHLKGSFCTRKTHGKKLAFCAMWHAASTFGVRWYLTSTGDASRNYSILCPSKRKRNCYKGRSTTLNEPRESAALFVVNLQRAISDLEQMRGPYTSSKKVRILEKGFTRTEEQALHALTNNLQFYENQLDWTQMKNYITMHDRIQNQSRKLKLIEYRLHRMKDKEQNISDVIIVEELAKRLTHVGSFVLQWCQRMRKIEVKKEDVKMTDHYTQDQELSSLLQEL
jgi:hypothetical protein